MRVYIKYKNLVHKKIFLISLPLMFSNLVLPIIGIVNTALVGHLNDSEHLAAVGLGVSIINVLCFLFAFFRMSITGLVAQSLDSAEQMLVVLFRAAIIATLISIVFMLLKTVIIGFLLSVIKVDYSVKVLVKDFCDIGVYLFWFALLNYIFIGFFIGIGRTKVVFYSSIVMMTVSVILSLILVVMMEYNTLGVAISLVLSYLCTSIFLFFSIFRFFIKQKISISFIIKKADLFRLKEYVPFLKLNTNIFVRSICLLLAFNSFYIFSGKYGKDILAANTILVEISMFMAMFLEAMANTTESLVAKAYVSKNIELFREVLKKTLLQGTIITIVLVFIYACFSSYIIEIFTSIDDVKIQLNKYIVFSILLPLVASISFWIDGVFVGLLKTVSMRNSMLISSLVYIMLVYLFESFDNYGLWIALLAFYIIRTITLMLPLSLLLRRGI